MAVLIQLLLVYVATCIVNCGRIQNNRSTSTKDTYVVHATVYQVGILTNKTDGEMAKEQGHQEAITFYKHNGSAIDLSGIRNPLMTNVTAQSMLGLAPVENVNQTQSIIPWSALEKIASLQFTTTTPGNLQSFGDLKQSAKIKRDLASVPVKIVKGAAIISPEEGIQSLSLPPLLALNNNLSHIPVPIPNTSVVRYAKINTLVKSP